METSVQLISVRDIDFEDPFFTSLHHLPDLHRDAPDWFSWIEQLQQRDYRALIGTTAGALSLFALVDIIRDRDLFPNVATCLPYWRLLGYKTQHDSAVQQLGTQLLQLAIIESTRMREYFPGWSAKCYDWHYHYQNWLHNLEFHGQQNQYYTLDLTTYQHHHPYVESDNGYRTTVIRWLNATMYQFYHDDRWLIGHYLAT